MGRDVARNILDEGGSVIMGDLIEDQLLEIQQLIHQESEPLHSILI
ncbi:MULTISPECIES: hypothetical protein [Oceanobacillus]|nr:hypothetical protein [Oceanobacillus sojae]